MLNKVEIKINKNLIKNKAKKTLNFEEKNNVRKKIKRETSVKK